MSHLIKIYDVCIENVLFHSVILLDYFGCCIGHPLLDALLRLRDSTLLSTATVSRGILQ